MTATVTPELVRQAQNGDNDAINNIISRLDRVVNKLARKGGAKNSDLEDKAQELRIAIWQKAIPSWDPEGGAAFSTWAWWKGRSKERVLRVSAARKPKQYSLSSPEKATSSSHGRSAGSGSIAALLRDQRDVLERLDTEESVETLRMAFGHLKDDEKLILSLRFWEGQTLREISRRTKAGELDFGRRLSHQGCLSLQRRALDHLKRVIDFLNKHRTRKARAS